MRVSLIKSDKISDLILPTKIKGNYWITDTDEFGNEKNLICIEAFEDKWKLVSNNEVSCQKNDTPVPYILLEENNFYVLKTNSNNSMIIYCSDIFDKTYQSYSIEQYKKNEISIGKSFECTISYNSVNILEKHATIDYINNCYVISPIGMVYLNDILINSPTILENGDIIFIMGLKIILEIKNNISYLIINNPQNQLNTKLGIYQNEYTQEDNYIEQEELDIKLYTDDDIFHKKPRFLRETTDLEINVDAPPAKQTADDKPLLLTVGPMLTMSMISLMSAFTAIDNVTTNNMPIKQALPTLVISGAMLCGTFVWPTIIRKWENKKREKNEKMRQLKYKKYIEEKRKLIQEEIIKQKNILTDNYPTTLECQNIILSKMTRLWERRLGDSDFLTVNLGTGNQEMKIKIKYPEEHFTMVEDNLNDTARELGQEPKQIQNVSIPLSLIENNIVGVIGNNVQTSNYMSQLFLQIMAFHSYDDLKIVMLTNNEKEHYWKFLKVLPHLFSNDKKIRFFGVNSDEYKEIFYVLEKEFQSRIEEEGKNPLIKPHYLIVTDNFKLVRNFEFVKKLLNSKEHHGFSLMILTEKITNIPDQCKSFVNIYQEKAELYKNEVNNKAVIFSTELNNKYQYYNCAKVLANIYLDITSEVDGQLPEQISFLQMYDVGKIEQLNILNRWHKNNPILSLAAPVGIGKSGEKIVIDLHEKYHGPHGLVAGMTGSGKSEFIITYIISMAINYHPHEVQFILIDYKGGGLAGAFENSNFKLPHLVGTITNLDANEIKRSLVSIESELKNRQRLFNLAREKTGESTIDIYKYQKMYREGIIDTPISHLFIISDEFAELKNQQPEFMSQLISTARIGRSLGVHLILATQKPSGVVDPQIWSNTRFRVCLKVQEKSDSSEVIKKPDAALLKQTGRFYFQVGFDEIFVIGQTAWCGSNYIPSEKIRKELDTSVDFIDNIGYTIKSIETKKQIDTGPSYGEELVNLVKTLSDIAKEENIIARPLWLEKISEYIYVNNLIQKYNYKKENYIINPIVGELDNPEMQKQHLLTLPLTNEGNALVYGVTGTGKENFITTIMYSSMIAYSPKEVNYYIVDFGSESLNMFKDAPIVGDIIHNEEKEKISNLFKLLQDEIDNRKKLFSDYNGDYKFYCKNSGSTLPSLVIVINNFEAYQETYPEFEEQLNVLTRDGLRYGINFILTINTPNGVRFKLKQNFNQEFVLQQNNDDDYSTILGNVRKNYPSRLFGRGIIKHDDNVYEFQTALVCNKEQIQEYIKKLSIKQKEVIKEKAKKIPILPEFVSYEDIKDDLGKTNEVIVGISKSNLDIVKYDFRKNLINTIISNDITDTYKFIKPFVNQLLYLNNSKLTFINLDDYELEENYNKYIEYVNKDYDNYFEKLHKYILESYENYVNNNYNKEILKSEKHNTIIILGLDSFLNKLSIENKKKFGMMFDKAKELEKINFIIIDSVDKIKKVELELWYKSNSNNTEGIWIGNGINDQFSIKLSQRTNELKESINDEFCFIVKRGKPILVKYVIDFNINLK